MPATRECAGRAGVRTAVAVVSAMLVACTFPDLPMPTPMPTLTAPPSATPTTTATSPPAEPSPSPTAALGPVPDFAAGDIVASLIDGLRVRQRPGTLALVTTGLLPLDAEMQVIMGPFPADGFSWYLVTDADPDEPQFEEGWVAAGYEPDPFLRPTSRVAEATPFVASMAGVGPAEEGPVDIGDGDHAIRWIAADPEAVGCRFAVSLAPGGGEPVPTIRATIGTGMDRGTLQPHTFGSLGVRGPAFVQVDTDCAWAMVVLRLPSPAPSPTESG